MSAARAHTAASRVPLLPNLPAWGCNLESTSLSHARVHWTCVGHFDENWTRALVENLTTRAASHVDSQTACHSRSPRTALTPGASHVMSLICLNPGVQLQRQLPASIGGGRKLRSNGHEEPDGFQHVSSIVVHRTPNPRFRRVDRHETCRNSPRGHPPRPLKTTRNLQLPVFMLTTRLHPGDSIFGDGDGCGRRRNGGLHLTPSPPAATENLTATDEATAPTIGLAFFPMSHLLHLFAFHNRTVAKSPRLCQVLVAKSWRCAIRPFHAACDSSGSMRKSG